MPHPRKKSAHRTTKTPSKSPLIMDDKVYIVLDHATTCTNWYRLWSSFGFSEQQWSSRATKVGEYTQKLMGSKLSTYKEQINKRKKLVKQSVEDYEDLISRTGLLSSIEISIFDGLKLKEQEIYIDKKMQELLIKEGDLIQQRTEFENKQKQLCKLLNSSPIEFDENATLSLMGINQKIQDHVKMLNDLRDLRLNQVSTYHRKIKEYTEKLEWTPPSASTVEYLLLEKFDHCLTADCLNEIESTMHQLESQIEAQISHFFVLQTQLGHLYERLKKHPKKDYCLALKTDRENINAFVIKQLEHEITCLREERMKHGKEYRQSIHQQILNLLEKAHLGDKERAIFNKLESETLSPDLLEAYDNEYERISQLYEKRKPVLDAYEKWLSFWNDFVAFTKASTDPARFRTRGYNAEVEGRKRKKFLKELPQIEQEFLNILSEYNDPSFLIDNTPIRQKFDEAHHQVPTTALSTGLTPKTVVGLAQRSALLTPSRLRTPAATPRRIVNKTANLATTVHRPAKTPMITPGRKLLTKVASKTECQSKRAKPRVAPASKQTPALPVHPPARTDDQPLDFSLLHTMKNVHGQMKVMTSTPNSSFNIVEKRPDKTAHNTIGRRRSKRLSKQKHVPLLLIEQVHEETLET